MNTKTTKFLAVLAVLAMAFVALAAVVPAQANDAVEDPTVVPVTPANQGVELAYLADGPIGDETYDAMLYDSYKLSSMTIDSDNIPTYTVTAKGLITHKNAVDMYGNWAGLGFVAPEGATHYIAAQYLTLEEAQAATVDDLGAVCAVGEPQKVGSTPDHKILYNGFADYKSAQDYYQVFLWSDDETVVAEDSDLMIFHVILNVTPASDALKLTGDEPYSVKGVLDNGVKITGDSTTTFTEYTGTITVGKNVLTADNFTGTITSSNSTTTAAVQITTWTAGDLEVTTGNYKAATSSAVEVFYVTLAANAREGASANSTLYVPSGQYLYTEMTATLDTTKELNITNAGTIKFGAEVTLTSTVVNNGTIDVSTAGATFTTAKVSGNGTFKVGDQDVEIPGGIFANNIEITQTYVPVDVTVSEEDVVDELEDAIEAETWPVAKKVTIDAGAIYSGTITYVQKYTYETSKTGTYATFKAEMNVKAAAGGLTVTTGSLTIAGSVNGEYSQSYIGGYSDDIFVGADKLKVIGGTFTFNGDVTLNGDLELTGATVNVSKEADLTIGDGKQIKLDGTSILYVDGTVSLDNLEQVAVPITSTAASGAVVKVSDTGVLNPVIITKLPAAVKLVTEGGMEIQYVYDTALGTHNYPANQILIVDGTWTLANTAVINVSGRLIVPAGSTLVIEAGAILNIEDKAQFIVEGTLNIDEPETEAGAAGIVNINEGEMTVSGTVSDAGEVNLSQDMVLTILEGGKFTVESDGKVVTATGSEFTVSAGAELIVKGCIDGVEISNMGSVLINSSYPAQSEARINHLLKDAVTEVRLYTIEAGANARLVIDDKDLRISSYRDTDTHETKYVTINDFNTIFIGGALYNIEQAAVNDDDYNVEVSNIIVTSVSDKDSSTVTMFVKGTLQANYAYVGDSVGVTTYTPRAYMAAVAGEAGASLKVTDSLRITDNSGFALVSGNMYLTGTITTQSSLATFVMTEVATLTVTDDGNARIFGTAISSEKGVNATKIIIPVVEDNKTVKVYTYMSVDKALEYLASAEDAVGEANVLGNQTMKASSTLGGEDVLIVSGKLTIGEKNGDDVKLTIAEDSTLKGAGYVYVNGTLYAEDKSDVKIKDSYISADVKTVQVDDKGKEVKNGWAKWTNVLTAIKETEDGDVVITRDGASTTMPKYVYVTSNLTIPEGVNLVIPTGAADLILNDGVTLVIDGSVEIGAGANIKAQTAFNLVAYKISKAAYSSAIVVNGSLTTAYKVAFADGTYGPSSNTEEGAYVALVNKNNPAWGAPIAGAYYALSNGNYVISGMETAIAQLDKIDGDITINGNVKAGVTDFTATEYTKNIIVNNANVKYKEYGAGTPNIKTVFTVLALNIECPDGISAATLQAKGEFNGMIVTDKSEISATGVTGMTVTAKYNKAAVVTEKFEMSGKGDSFMVSSGEVVFNAITPVMSAANVNNAVYIAAGAKLTIDGTTTLKNVFVYGTLNVPATKTLIVNGTIVVDGNVTVAQQTATAAPGTFKLDNGDMYIGITGKDMNNGEAVANAAAVYSGPLTLVNNPCVFVLNGATVSGDIVDVLDDMYSTAFVVEGKVWFTAYAKADNETVTVSKVPVSNAVLEGWAATADGSRIDFDPDADEYDYYTVRYIGTCDVLYAVLEYDLYQIYILADQGVHNISIDGKLMQSAAYGTDVFFMNGIDAGTHEVTYTLLDGYQGTAVMKLQKSDNNVTLFGLNFTISGDEAGVTYLQLTGIEPADPVTPEEKSEWTITTILLVILVILIAVMAVIVAIRLNRS